jgi:NADPH-dependent 2,4-dienoyl-CoA reductase/sulfur reductase-like enzyme
MSDNTGRLVIIGRGPAGLSAARGYRDAGGGGDIRLISVDTEPPYDRPPLSKEFLRGGAGDDDLPMEKPDFYRSHDIKVTLNDTVTDLDPGARTVTTGSGETVSFEFCVLATGSEPTRPPIPGADHPDVRVLRSAVDARRLRDTASHARTAVVVGSGFIGCEAAVSLSRRGIQVTIIAAENLPQSGRLGDIAGTRILGWLKSEGVSVLRSATLEGIEDGYRVHTDLVPTMDTQLIVLATGVEPRTALATAAGLDMARGRVRADEHMRTSAPGVLAAGDVALAYNVLRAARPLGRALG